LPVDSTVLFVSLDDLYFSDHSLLDLASKFTLAGGKKLLLDEMYKYPDWSGELNLIYDENPELQVVFISSSILEIYRGDSDLSRRAVSYLLHELSLREFIELELGTVLPAVLRDQVLNDHLSISHQILEQIKPTPIFQNYLKWRVYPFFMDGKENHLGKLRKTVQLTLEIDLNAMENMDYKMLFKLKKLIRLIGTSASFTPNVSELSQKIGISRPSLLRAFDLLERARILQSLHKPNLGIGALTKPEKLYLSNTNLAYALGEENVNVGSLRETFFANQLNVSSQVNLVPKSDFIIDKNPRLKLSGKIKVEFRFKESHLHSLLKMILHMGLVTPFHCGYLGFCIE